jgi:hypothetical protein
MPTLNSISVKARSVATNEASLAISETVRSPELGKALMVERILGAEVEVSFSQHADLLTQAPEEVLLA